MTALLCDTGALVDYLVAAAPDHEAFRFAVDRATTRYVPGLVLAKVDCFLRKERAAMRAFMADLERGAFTYAPATAPLLCRAMEIDARFQDLEIGLVDASVVALAEEVGVTRIATRDVRDFGVVTLRSGKHFELVVNPTVPDRHGKRTKTDVRKRAGRR